MYNIRDYGASPSMENNAPAIQSAINACNAAGGGRVLVPAGRYLSGNLRLLSNVYLYLEPGAVLEASKDFNDYKPSTMHNDYNPDRGNGVVFYKYLTGFIYADGAENVGIEGAGVIDGGGRAYDFFPAENDPMSRRPHLVLFCGCDNVRVSGVTLKNPVFFSFFGCHSRHITVTGITIESQDVENGDGIDFDGSSDVVISDCRLNTGDDGISLKCNNPDFPCERYVISNCIFSSVWAGIRIGIESSADMRDITVTGCVFNNCNDAVKIQTCAAGTFEYMRFSNLIMRNVHRPVFITRTSYSFTALDRTVRPTPGALRNITFDGIDCVAAQSGTDYQRNIMLVAGLPGLPVENITFRNMNITFAGGVMDEVLCCGGDYLDYSFLFADIFTQNGELPACGLLSRHVRNLRIENCVMHLAVSDTRPMIATYDTTARINGTELSGSYGTALKVADTDLMMSEWDCSSNGEELEPTPLTAEENQYYEELKALTKETAAKFERWAIAWDEVYYRCSKTRTIGEAEWLYSGNEMCARIELDGNCAIAFSFVGNMRLLLDGEEVEYFSVPEIYGNKINAGAFLRAEPGIHELHLIWDDTEKCCGISFELPFGRFTPLQPGIYGVAVIGSNPETLGLF